MLIDLSCNVFLSSLTILMMKSSPCFQCGQKVCHLQHIHKECNKCFDIIYVKSKNTDPSYIGNDRFKMVHWF